VTDGKGAAAHTAPRHQSTNTDKDAGKRHFTSGDGAGERIQHRQACSGDDRIDAVELTRRLGFTAGEYISLSWKRPGDSPWRYRVVGYDPHRLANHVAMAGAGFNHYFLINPGAATQPSAAGPTRSPGWPTWRSRSTATRTATRPSRRSAASPSSCRRGSARPRWGSSSRIIDAIHSSVPEELWPEILRKIDGPVAADAPADEFEDCGNAEDEYDR
jgi:hypothetical protein